MQKLSAAGAGRAAEVMAKSEGPLEGTQGDVRFLVDDVLGRALGCPAPSLVVSKSALPEANPPLLLQVCSAQNHEDK